MVTGPELAPLTWPAVRKPPPALPTSWTGARVGTGVGVGVGDAVAVGVGQGSPLQQGTPPQFGVGQGEPIVDPESVQFAHWLRTVGEQPVLQVNPSVTDSPPSTQALGQTTFTTNVKSGPVVEVLVAVGAVHPGAFATTSTVSAIAAVLTKKCRSLAVTPVLLTNVTVVPGAGVPVAVGEAVGDGVGVGRHKDNANTGNLLT